MKFLDEILKAEKILQQADHMAYVTFPLIKDKRLLFKVLQETKNAVLLCVSSILEYESYRKRVVISKDFQSNLRIFREKVSSKYGITPEETIFISELVDISQQHKESPFEFIRGSKIVILSNSMIPRTVPLERIKRFIFLAKSLIKKAKETIKKEINIS